MELKSDFEFSLLLEILDLKRSTYYYQLSKLTQVDKDHKIKDAIQEIYETHKGN